MCTFGLNVFLETQKCYRQRRGIFVALSFIILCLNILGDLPNLYLIFVLVFDFTSGVETLRLQQQQLLSWWSLANAWLMVISWWIGDGLLVGQIKNT